MDAITKILARTPCDAEYDSFVEELAAAGYVIVPKEPTKDMLSRIFNVMERDNGSYYDAYQTIIAAAPKVGR
jgi:hypothetical protein